MEWRPFGGHGNDFILGSKANEQDIGNEGDDWIERGTSDGAPGDNFDPLGGSVIGNDVFIGDGENAPVDRLKAATTSWLARSDDRPLLRRFRLRLGRLQGR